jgi:PAS domain S-box-containing protein
MDAEGLILDMNSGVQKTFGHTRTAVVGRRLAEVFVPAELRTRHEAGLRRYLATGESAILGRRIEVEALDAAGNRIPVELSIVPLRGASPPIFVGHLRNISERKRADRRLRLAAAAAQAVAESATALAAIEGVTRAIGQELEWALVQFWRVDGEAQLLRRVHIWTSWSGLTEHVPAPALRRGEGLPGTVWELGRRVWVEAISASDLLPRRREALVANGLLGGFAFPVSVGGEVHGVVEAFSQKTEPTDPQLQALLEVIGGQLSHAVAMHDAREALHRANGANNHFLAMLSHELRTPLQPILGWAAMLEQSQVDDATRVQAATAIRRNAEAEIRLVEDLLDVSRIVTGKLSIDRASVNLVAVLQNSIEQVMPAATAKGVAVQLSADPGVPPVSGDPKRLQQVFSNLLGNAVKFTGPGGVVDVLLDPVSDRVCATVKDTGEGIAPDLLPHIFDRYRQGERGEGFPSPGLGLGLSIVRDLVAAHGGTVTAASEGTGRGATFTVCLPEL